jgi:tetratricopeptide (TPR) repeat protein
MSFARRSAAILALLVLPAWGQDGKKLDDVLQLKNGGFLVGRILKLDAEWVDFFANGEKEPRKIMLRDLMPGCVYDIRLKRIDKSNGAARFELGEFCMASGLYSTAMHEFEEAGRHDKTLEEKAKKRRDEARSEFARSRFEEAKKLHLAKQHESAKDILRTLMEKFSDTPYGDEAKKLDAKMAEEISKENAEKKKILEDAKEAKAMAAELKKEAGEKAVLGEIAKLVEAAQKLWAEGLDHDSKNLTKADRAWKGGEAALLQAKANIEFLLKSNDVEIIKKAKDQERLVDHWLVKTYYRLGRMWAVELNYPMALEWLNKGLKLPHDDQMDHLMNEIILQISLKKINERAAGRGY